MKRNLYDDTPDDITGEEVCESCGQVGTIIWQDEILGLCTGTDVQYTVCAGCGEHYREGE